MNPTALADPPAAAAPALDEPLAEPLAEPLVVALAAQLDGIAALEQVIRSAQGAQLRLMRQARMTAELVEGIDDDATIAARELATRSFIAELATTLVVHERTASRMLGEAEALAGLPATEAALAAGAMSMTQARSVIEFTTGASPDVVAAIDTAAAERAPHQTNTKLRRVLRRLRDRLEPVPLETRHALAAAERRVCLEADRDGMAWLSIHLEAERAVAVQAHLDAVVDRRLAADPDETRTRAQLAADVAAALLLGIGAQTAGTVAPASSRGVVVPRVLVTVPVLSLLGVSDEPAELDGYGPIDPETARRLAAHAPSFTRILTHPETGAVLSYGRTRYRVPADLAGYLAVRDGGCRFPGCGRRAAKCDLDHTVAWAEGGTTDHDNLALLCRKHHRLKHETRWRVGQEPGGVLRWRSPAGREVRDGPGPAGAVRSEGALGGP